MGFATFPEFTKYKINVIIVRKINFCNNMYSEIKPKLHYRLLYQHNFIYF